MGQDEGGKVVLIVAKKGCGKTVLLSCITERITACPDAQLIQVNLGKHREDRRWAPLAAANALGREDAGRARRILQWVLNAIEERSKGGDDARVTPTPSTPLLVVKIDEVDQVAADPVCQDLLAKIASKCRSEGVALIISGQRATAQWMGGADLRANVDIAVLGRFARAGEARKATGEEIDLPDMGEYGEGRPGVFLITELGGGGGYERGRVFKLDDPADIDKIVARRAAARRPYVPEPALPAWPACGPRSPARTPPAARTRAPTAAAAITQAASGQMIQGTEQITAKIGQARALAEQDPELPEIPPEMAGHAARAARRAAPPVLRPAYTDVTIPDEADSARCWPCWPRPAESPPGPPPRRWPVPARTVSTRQFAGAGGAAGHAEVRGTGSGRRWHLTEPPAGRCPPAGRYLRAVAQGGDAPDPPVPPLDRTSDRRRTVTGGLSHRLVTPAAVTSPMGADVTSRDKHPAAPPRGPGRDSPSRKDDHER